MSSIMKTIAALAMCGVATAASAADNGIYLGIGAQRSDFALEETISSKDEGFKLTAGLRLLDSFGIEASYADHGHATVPSGINCIALVGVSCPDVARVSARTTAAFAVGFLDLPMVDLFGKIGYSRTSSRLGIPGFSSFGGSDKNSSLAWGAGLQAHFLSLGARAEFEQFRTMGNEKLSAISVSFIYTFL